MIPNCSNGMKPLNQSKTVFINPQKIPTTHINPIFLLRKPYPASSIYVNPAFFPAHSEGTESGLSCTQMPENISEISVEPQHNPKNKLIIKSRTKLIRESFKPIQKVSSEASRPQLIKIGSKKLIRRSSLNKVYPSISTKKDALNKYKFVRKTEKYALLKKKLTRFSYNESKPYKNMKLNFHNNNNVFYKSTKTKYERIPAQPSANETCKYIAFSTKPKERVIFVRGNKFILDKQGLSLKRAQSDNKGGGFKLKRIDIGGVTYVENSNSNLLVRTESHWTRNHLNLAKSKSITFLSNLQTKTNLPCLIYQKLGKCSAYEMGRCTKVHDKNCIAVCKRHLRGKCSADKNCLLSHNVSMTKMPTCKFFLKGLCVRDDCVYLHKKLSKEVDICVNFLSGFCQDAEKCTKRHEFECGNQKKNGEKCQSLLCIFCRPKSAVNLNKSTNSIKTEKGQDLKSPSVTRYFFENDVVPEDHAEIEKPKRKGKSPTIGDLPSFIPFN